MSTQVQKSSLYKEDVIPYSEEASPPKNFCDKVLFIIASVFLGLLQCLVVLGVLFIGLFFKGGPIQFLISKCILGQTVVDSVRTKKIAAMEAKARSHFTKQTAKDQLDEDRLMDDAEFKQVFVNTHTEKSENLKLQTFIITSKTCDSRNRIKGKWIILTPGMHSSTYSQFQVMIDLFNGSDVEGVICTNPPGTGKSEGKTKSPLDFCTAGSCAFDYLYGIYKEKLDVTFWGHSMGGASAIKNANDKSKLNPEISINVVLDRTFKGQLCEAIGKSPIVLHPCRELLSSLAKKFFNFDLSNEVNNSQVPIIVIGNKGDTVIDFDQSALKLQQKNILHRYETSFKNHPTTDLSKSNIALKNEISTLSSTVAHSLPHTLALIGRVFQDFKNKTLSSSSYEANDPLDQYKC
jgi:hypothetical protein